nr:MAG TPA: hypothetical protein [Caudoviricetes sp.]
MWVNFLYSTTLGRVALTGFLSYSCIPKLNNHNVQV